MTDVFLVLFEAYALRHCVMCVGHADTHVRASTLHSESTSRDSTQALTEKAILEQRVMAGRVSVADSVARVALVTMEEAEQLDIELETHRS